MPKTKQTPGAALSELLKKHGLNYNRLAKAVGLSSAMIRLIARDENPVSASVAFRFAKFFKMKPEFWLALQVEFDLAKTTNNKKLARELKDIPTVDKATFERKPRTVKAGKTAKKAGAKKAAPKGASARGRKPAAKKAAAKKTAGGKRGRPAATAVKTQKKTAKSPAVVKKAPAAKPVKAKPVKAKPVQAKPAVKPSAPPKETPPKAPHPVKPVAVKPEPAVVETRPVPPPQPVPPVDTTVNEPQI